MEPGAPLVGPSLASHLAPRSVTATYGRRENHTIQPGPDPMTCFFNEAALCLCLGTEFKSGAAQVRLNKMQGRCEAELAGASTKSPASVEPLNASLFPPFLGSAGHKDSGNAPSWGNLVLSA